MPPFWGLAGTRNTGSVISPRMNWSDPPPSSSNNHMYLGMHVTTLQHGRVSGRLSHAAISQRILGPLHCCHVRTTCKAVPRQQHRRHHEMNSNIPWKAFGRIMIHKSRHLLVAHIL